MKQSITFSQFVDAFRAHDRQDQFTYEGKRVLFDQLEDYEEQTGSEIELDVIALCCEYAESDVDDVVADYSLDVAIDGFADMDEDEQINAVEEWLIDHTWLMGMPTSRSFVFQQF